MQTNVLYYGDNLDILRKHIPDNSIDLIYLDPPFNSKATYNILFKEPTGEPSQAQISAFEDTWHWGDESERTFQEIIDTAPSNIVEMMTAFRKFIHENDMMAYLAMMCVRLLELKKVLKDTGSIYLHCDPTASHYLKILMDAIFGVKEFRNEIAWPRFTFHADAKRFGRVGDRLLFYTKTDNHIWHKLHRPYSEKSQRSHFIYEDADGRIFRLSDLTPPGGRGPVYEFHGITRPWRFTREKMLELEKQDKIYWEPGRIPSIKRYLDEVGGAACHDVWSEIPPINSQAKERLPYPTQKLEALLERIIKAASDEENVVLDPFCGCGTAIVVAQRLNRKWIGIDITHLAISIMKWRLNSMFPGIKYKVIGEPVDLSGARELASQNKYQFQWWALSLVGARPYGDKKRGADTGIDGYLYFMDEKDKVRKAIVQVKSGGVSVNLVRDLRGVIDREKAEMGIFITLEPSTKPMETEAVSQGFYRSPLGKDYPKMQILTVDELLKGKKPDMPPWVSPVQAPPVSKKREGQAVKML